MHADINWAFGSSLIDQSIDKIDGSLSIALNILFSGEISQDYSSICDISSEFQSFATLVENILLFLNPVKDSFEELTEFESNIALSSISLFNTMRTHLEDNNLDPSSIISIFATLKRSLIEASDSISTLQSFNNSDMDSTDLFKELSDAASKIEAIANHLKKENKSILIDSTLEVTDALFLLMKYATLCQEEIVNSGKYLNSDNPYLKDSKWTEGLISAAKSIVSSMSFLSESSRAYVSSNETGRVESVLVGAKEVASGTIQLVTAARVKTTNLYSENQLGLENASKQVASATSSLAAVAKKDYMRRFSSNFSSTDVSNISSDSNVNKYQMTVLERNQQIEIMDLESKLSQARAKLSLIRKKAYNKI